MSFDVFLERFADGESAEVDAQRVRDILQTASYRGPDGFGFYCVSFPDGVEVEFSAAGLESDEPFTGCAFHMRGFGDDLVAFLFDVARAGDMVIMPAMEGHPLVTVSDGQEDGIPADLAETLRPIAVRSAGELGALLTGGFDGWSAYRDHVLRRPDEDGSE